MRFWAGGLFLDGLCHTILVEADHAITLGVGHAIAEDRAPCCNFIGPLQDLLRAPTITEIMVVKSDQIYVERDGVLELSGRRFLSDLFRINYVKLIPIKQKLLCVTGLTVSTQIRSERW